jgi:hypothetical protein
MRSNSDIGEAVARFDYTHNPSPLVKGAIPPPSATQRALWAKGCSHDSPACPHNGSVASAPTRGAEPVRANANGRAVAGRGAKRAKLKPINGNAYSWQSIKVVVDEAELKGVKCVSHGHA